MSLRWTPLSLRAVVASAQLEDEAMGSEPQEPADPVKINGLANKPEIKARMASSSDLSSLLYIEKRSNSEDMWSPEEFTRILANNKIRIVMVETFLPDEDGNRKASPVAYLAFEARKKETVLWSLVVIPKLLRRGVGKGLMGWLKEISGEHLQVERISAVLRESDLPSQLFLKACGFVCKKSIKTAYECPPEVGLFFQCPVFRSEKP